MKSVVATVHLVILLAAAASLAPAAQTDLFTAEDVLNIRYASSPVISPDGERIAYLVMVPREADDEPGPYYAELHVVSVRDGRDRAYVAGKVSVSSPRWSPDGKSIAFLMKRGEGTKRQVWVIPVDGGEAYPVTASKSDVLFFRWHPDGARVAYTASPGKTEREKKLDEMGYGFEFFEEDWKHRNIYIAPARRNPDAKEARQLTDGVTVWSFDFDREGTRIVAAVSPRNLVDDMYMFKKIYIVNAETGEMKRVTENPGKLGNFALNPGGTKLLYAAASDRSDHAVSSAYVLDLKSGELVDLTPEKFRGHINWVGWKDDATVLYRADEGVWATLCLISATGGKRKVILDSRKTGINFYPPSYTGDFRHFALLGTSPDTPRDIFYWKPGGKLERLTTLNPWIASRRLGNQEVVRYKARDGLEIEGILIYPVDYVDGKSYPLIVTVHGGPESHYALGWHTGYFQPAQVLASEGYLVFMPNYRASTGYGIEFGKAGLSDAAGKEFDDIADGIEYLIERGLADGERVGLGGGSYGGFAAAWFSSYYTDYVKAVVMFVGISDLISKRGTTDIPYEELYVHSGKKLEEMWRKSLERSPIYHAYKSRTAVLILGGTADPRVHPSQSLEYYRRLKMNDHPAVRLVRYPGEVHGNRKQPGRIDVLHRSLDWFNWYVRDNHPLDGPLPPLDISDRYGLDLPE